jgi:hypothetical protein
VGYERVKPTYKLLVPKMPLRKRVCSDSIQEEFLFIKESCGSSDCSKVLCSVSSATLSINRAGTADSVHRVRTNKRQNIEQQCMQEVATTDIIKRVWVRRRASCTRGDVYCLAKENHSFHSRDRASSI